MFRDKTPGAPSTQPIRGGLLDPRILRAQKEIAKVPPKKRDKYKNPPKG